MVLVDPIIFTKPNYNSFLQISLIHKSFQKIFFTQTYSWIMFLLTTPENSAA